jgi:CubicO group peptidase (beta-lactamase class C family)
VQQQLEATLADNKVVGGVLGIMQGDDVTLFAAGVANKQGAIDVTTDTLFQIGSITKVWTATLIMMLVDEGLLDLDEPVVTYLPAFRVADADVTARVTLRDWLSHRSGIGGDHILDTGRGDDTLERYVETCADLGQDHDLGATMSYCNSGYSVAGRIIEVITGKSWDAFLRERLITPLGLTHTNTLPEEAIMFRAAVGHVGDNVAPAWVLPRSAGPAGLINATATDLLKFARLHLDEGRGPDGAQLLSVSAVKQMQEAQIDVPDRYTLGDRWGVGWILFDWDGHPVYGHDGTTLGQRAYLRVAPEADLAVCLLSTGGVAGPAFKALCTEVLRERAGIAVPALPSPPDPAPELDLSLYAGTFARLNVALTIEQRDGALVGYVDQSGPLAEAMKKDKTEDEIAADREKNALHIVPVDTSLFLATSAELPVPVPVVYFDFTGDRPSRLHFGARAMTRRD